MTGPAAAHAPAPALSGVPAPLDRQRATQGPARLRVLSDLIGPEPVPTDLWCWTCRVPAGVACHMQRPVSPDHVAHADRAEVAARWAGWRDATAEALAVHLDHPADPAARHRVEAAMRRLSRSATVAGSPGRWRLPDRWAALAVLEAAGVRDARR